MKQLGRVRLSVAKVVTGERCVCGKPHQQCAEEWDAQLGIRGHSADSSHSEYKANVIAIKRAIVQGLDPYCFEATLRAYGYTGSGWEARHTPESRLLAQTLGLGSPYREENGAKKAKTSPRNRRKVGGDSGRKPAAGNRGANRRSKPRRDR